MQELVEAVFAVTVDLVVVLVFVVVDTVSYYWAVSLLLLMLHLR